jgi:hypothetical protein
MTRARAAAYAGLKILTQRLKRVTIDIVKESMERRFRTTKK